MSLDSAPGVPTEEVTCPLCGGSGQEAAIAGPVMCSRCFGTGLVEQEVRSVHDEQAQRRAADARTHLQITLIYAQSARMMRAKATGLTPVEQITLEYAEAQTHALIAIAKSLGGPA